MAVVDHPEIGSLWRRKPPGREVVRVSRVWRFGAKCADPRDDGWCARLHPLGGGKPLICPLFFLEDQYEPCPPSPP